MDDTLKLGWSRGAAADARRTYRTVLGIELALALVIALVALLWPNDLARLLHFPEPFPPVWARAWGALLVALVLLLLPGWLDPVHNRWPNIAGIVGRLALGVLYLCLGGFAVLGVIELAAGVLLAWLYLRLLKAELMARP